MRHYALRLASCFVVPALLLAACSASESPSPAPSDGQRVPQLPAAPGGKADSYVNQAAKEFEFTGSAHMAAPAGLETMSAEDADKALKTAADSRLGQVASGIQSYLSGKAREMNAEIPKELPPEIAKAVEGVDDETRRRILENWRTQQEVSAATRSSKKHLESIRKEEDGTYAFDFEVEALLSNKLSSKVFAESDTFEVTVTQWQGEPKTEVIKVKGAPTASTDGYPRYNELFADGVLEVALHIGGDYNEE